MSVLTFLTDVLEIKFKDDGNNVID